MQLQNGCACCTASDELFDSVEQLLDLNAAAGRAPFDHVVIESTGVAEPKQVRARFQAAAKDEAATPVMARCELHTMVTVVDASSFVDEFNTREAGVAATLVRPRAVPPPSLPSPPPPPPPRLATAPPGPP